MELNRQPGGVRMGARPVGVDILAWRAVRALGAGRYVSPRLRFPAMFDGLHLGLTLYRGWNLILLSACASVSRLLVQQPLAFRWVQLQEEDGVGRFLYSLGEHCRYAVEVAGRSRRVMILVTQDEARELATAIDGIVNEAERLSSEACLICGARTARRLYFGRELPLCLLHQPEVLNAPAEEGLEGVWRHAIDWEQPGQAAVM